MNNKQNLRMGIWLIATLFLSTGQITQAQVVLNPFPCLYSFIKIMFYFPVFGDKINPFFKPLK